jgi:hypothetical protein
MNAIYRTTYLAIHSGSFKRINAFCQHGGLLLSFTFKLEKKGFLEERLDVLSS